MTSLNISKIDDIKFNDTLKNHNDIHTIVSLIVDRVKQIPSFSDLHLNIDLIVYICKIIDHILVESKLHNIDKFNLFKEIYLNIFPDTTEKELKTIKATIEYLHNIKEIMAVKTNWAKICRKIKSIGKVVLSVLSLS